MRDERREDQSGNADEYADRRIGLFVIGHQRLRVFFPVIGKGTVKLVCNRAADAKLSQ